MHQNESLHRADPCPWVETEIRHISPRQKVGDQINHVRIAEYKSHVAVHPRIMQMPPTFQKKQKPLRKDENLRLRIRGRPLGRTRNLRTPNYATRRPAGP